VSGALIGTLRRKNERIPKAMFSTVCFSSVESSIAARA
jgi:hypothetical protein